ncbi:hypothetical protein LguiA_028589 [Lonicera macranthoides]
MARGKLKSIITSFTSDGDFLALLSPNGLLKIWNTSTGSLLAEWKQSDGGSDARFSCMACSFFGKKGTKEGSACLVALGTEYGDVLAINVFTGEVKWKSTGCHSGGIAGLSFGNKGRRLYTVGSNGMVSEIKSGTGEVIKEFKLSKKSISSSVCSCDEKIVASTSTGIRIFSIEDEKELLKFSTDSGLVQYISTSDDTKVVVTSGFGERDLQVWKCGLDTKSVSKEAVLSMRHPPVAIECKNGCNGEDSSIVLSVSEVGVAYIWNLMTSLKEIDPTTITVNAKKAETDLYSSGKSRKGRTSIVAARLNDIETDGQVKVLIAYGSIDSPHFGLVDITRPGEDIVIAAGEETVKTVTAVQENGVHAGKGLEEVATPAQKKKSSKKRAASDSDSANAEPLADNGDTEPIDGVKVDNDLTEPTMGEKLASLNLVEDNETKSQEKIDSSLQMKPPSADSVHVLLKQALHADDRALLLDCLFRKDEKIVANSITVLNPSDVLKLLESLISLIQSRGAVLACVIPWVRSLLVQHASGIMSQESSLLALNSLYQLIESRNSTFNASTQLSSCLDLLYAGTVNNDEVDENEIIQPVMFEDKDESEEDGSEEEEEAMETDEESENLEMFGDDSDLEGSGGMSED